MCSLQDSKSRFQKHLDIAFTSLHRKLGIKPAIKNVVMLLSVWFTCGVNRFNETGKTEAAALLTYWNGNGDR